MKICPTCRQTYSDDVEFCPRDGARLAAQATDTEAQFAAGLSRRFRIVRRLGEGGMGSVFLAEQIGVGNRPVALKVLLRSLLDNPDFLRRFQEEAASTGRIRHPNVVTIYESGQADDGTPYIAMEFLEGESLRQALQRRGQLPVPEVAEILQQAARGLNAAHKLGIIHRDLKPDNIFLTYPDDVGAGLVPALPAGIADTGRPQGPPLPPVVVKIVDFGIAKLRESSTHTQTGMVLGTPAYMSYEQASGMRSDELDARSDIYSLGVVVYEMLTGRVPFQSDTPAGFLRKHLMDEPPPFRAFAPGLPISPAVESVVMKALTKDRDQRYASALEFAREVTSAAQLLPTPESPVTIPQTRIVSPPALAKPPHLPVVAESPSRMKFVVLGLVLLAMIAGGIWYFSRSAVQPPAHVTSQSSGATEPAGQKPTVEVPLAELGPTPGAAKVNHKDTITFREEDIAKEWVNPKDGLKYAWIPPGSFQMGCSPGDAECRDDERPPHQVAMKKGFWLGQTEVTVGAYRRFAGSTGAQMPVAPDFNAGWNNQDMPIVNVSWDDARAFCGWGGGRLPSEAEWEYAARAGSTEARYGPIDEVAWYSDNSGQKAHEVGRKRANGFGLFDMLGNVWEWVNDWYGENYYENTPSQDPTGPGSGQFRVLRGGSWAVVPRYVRVSYRDWNVPGIGYTRYVGFRCGGDVAGHKVGASQSPTAASRQPPKPASQPPDTKAQLAEKHFLKGYALFSNNDFDGAIAECRAAIFLKPDFADAHGVLGLALEQKGDLDGAIAEYREAIRLKPDFAETHYDLGLTLAKKRNLDGAIAEYREAIRLKPDYAEAHNFLGVVLGEKGDLDGEIAEHREAIRLRPGYAGAHWGLGMALGQKGDVDGAIVEYRDVVRLRPNDAQAHFGLGVNLGLKGDWDGEITEEREAIRLKPDHAMAHDKLGVALEQKGELQPALEEYRKAYELAPKNPTIRGDYEKLLKRLNPQQ